MRPTPSLLGVFLPLFTLSTLSALSACKGAPESAPPAAPGAGNETTLAPAPPGALFPTGAVLHGDRASLQYYLENVDTVANAQVELTYAPQTVVVTRNAGIRSLHQVSWD